VRAIVATGVGGPEVLELQEAPDPEPGPGELLVAVEAAGVNYRDVYEREGQQGREPPYVAGVEGAGRVVATGELVCWNDEPGSYAERVLVRAERAVAVPGGVSAELASAALLQGMTAHYLATDTYAVQAGDDVLVHAAAGGVGLLLTQVAKLRGGRVIATTSSGEKAALAREAGRTR
jgi:NADPH2:quinone reductase